LRDYQSTANVTANWFLKCEQEVQMTGPDPSHRYLIVWEFRVRAGCEARFEEVYGPAGDWVRLFDRSPHYGGTRLSRDVDQPGRYVTLDFWSSRCAYEAFRDEQTAKYEALDRLCSDLTEEEIEIGRFEMLG
jgi:heme-degrading monooxygenase HmoA